MAKSSSRCHLPPRARHEIPTGHQIRPVNPIVLHLHRETFPRHASQYRRIPKFGIPRQSRTFLRPHRDESLRLDFRSNFQCLPLNNRLCGICNIFLILSDLSASERPLLQLHQKVEFGEKNIRLIQTGNRARIARMERHLCGVFEQHEPCKNHTLPSLFPSELFETVFANFVQVSTVQTEFRRSNMNRLMCACFVSFWLQK